jgi:hypothetical protein
MICELEQVAVSADGKRLLRCEHCGREVATKLTGPMRAVCGPRLLTLGPGSELRLVFRELSITPKKDCGCKKFAKQMDKLGVDGCRAQRCELARRLQEKSAEFGLADFLTAGLRAITSGIALRINPLSPFLSLVDLAIERATARSSGS